MSRNFTLQQLNDITSGKKIAVERGCNAKGGCYCSGMCKDIVGWFVDGKFVKNENLRSGLENNPLLNCSYMENN